jgi:hypothetical protein
MNIENVIQRLTSAVLEVGCFNCGYKLNGFSITGADFDPFLHGMIYSRIISISSAVRVWRLPERFKEYENFGRFHEISKSCHEIISPKAEDLDYLVPIINLKSRERGSIAFEIDKNYYSEFIKIAAEAGYLSVSNSKTQVISNHSKSSYVWALECSKMGQIIVMVGVQTGPKYLDVFSPCQLTASIIQGIHGLNGKLFQNYLHLEDK